MKEVKFEIDCFACMTSEDCTISSQTGKGSFAGDTSTRAETTSDPVTRSHAGRRAGWIAACLAGFLLLAAAMFVAPATSSAQMAIGISVSFGPPALPVYAQPPCPAPGYIWTPGYWAWAPAYGYYWVPGTWVPAPFMGALWTPGYWAYDNGMYVWYAGYWGPVVGYYGGINYGYGYTGFGYYGGYWNRGVFYYNREVNRIPSRNFRYVYNQRVVERNEYRYISYHGGPGGTVIRPQLAAGRDRHFGAVGQQMQQERFARTNRVQWASVNRGRPNIAATPRAGEFHGSGIQRATRAGAPDWEPARNPERRPAPGRAPSVQEAGRAPSTPRYAAPAPVERPASARERNEQPAQRYNQPPSSERNQVRMHQPEAQQPARNNVQEQRRNSPPASQRVQARTHQPEARQSASRG
ncbi:MAG: hypothetical protein P8Z30_16150, partial [Acidobacteriota bacterium]